MRNERFVQSVGFVYPKARFLFALYRAAIFHLSTVTAVVEDDCRSLGRVGGSSIPIFFCVLNEMSVKGIQYCQFRRLL